VANAERKQNTEYNCNMKSQKNNKSCRKFPDSSRGEWVQKSWYFAVASVFTQWFYCVLA